jgi:hypothetical protein
MSPYLLFNSGVLLEADRVLAILNEALSDKRKRLCELVELVSRIAQALCYRTTKGKVRAISASQITALLSSGLSAQEGAGALGALDRGSEMLRQNVIAVLTGNEWLASPKRAELSATLIRQVTELAETKSWQGAFGGYPVCH